MDGPQGPGIYEIKTTYPIAGIVLILGGLGAGLNGLLPDEEEETEQAAGPPPTDPKPGEVGGAGDPQSHSPAPGGDQPPAGNRVPAEEGQPAPDAAEGERPAAGGQPQGGGQQPRGGPEPGQPQGGGRQANAAGQDTIACPSCGQPVSARAQFCTNCGANVAGE